MHTDWAEVDVSREVLIDGRFTALAPLTLMLFQNVVDYIHLIENGFTDFWSDATCCSPYNSGHPESSAADVSCNELHKNLSAACARWVIRQLYLRQEHVLSGNRQLSAWRERAFMLLRRRTKGLRPHLMQYAGLTSTTVKDMAHGLLVKEEKLPRSKRAAASGWT